jgi:hypothetical protein
MRLSNQSRYIYFILAFLGSAFGNLGHTQISSTLLMILFATLYFDLKVRYDAFGSLGIITATLILYSSFVYIFGQYIQPMPNWLIRYATFLLLSAICFAYSPQSQKISVKKLIPLAGIVWLGQIIIGMIASSKLVSFLGFGYDNYAHLYVFRTMLESNSALMGFSNPQHVVTFVGASPLGTHMSMALIAEVIGIDGAGIQKALSFFTLITILMPIAFIAVSAKIVINPEFSLLKKLAIYFFIIGVLIFGYPSHIFFSGYLTSNFATLLMLIAFGVLRAEVKTETKLTFLFILGAAEFLVYPLYSIFVLIFFIAVCVVGRTESLRLLSRYIRKSILRSLSILIGSSTLVLIALLGLLSGYGGGQFLAPGGISPLPLGGSMFIFGATLSTLFSYENGSDRFRIWQMSISGTIFVASFGLIYAYYKTNVPGQFWVVPYYPTKILISVLIIAFLCLVERMMIKIDLNQNGNSRNFPRSLLVITAMGILIAPAYDPWPFSGGFMGTTQGVIRSLNSRQSEVVDGNIISKSVGYSQSSQMPVLYLSDNHESELNTRWINSLQLNWSDDNWSKWMSARQLIETEKYDEAADVINGNFALVIDNYSKFRVNPVVFNAFEDICVIDVRRENSCRGVNQRP